MGFKPRKRGAPNKIPGGLGKVLFVRVNQELLDKLDEHLKRQIGDNPGITLSRSDIVRAILWATLHNEE